MHSFYVLFPYLMSCFESRTESLASPWDDFKTLPICMLGMQVLQNEVGDTSG
jgi:hypothetical protein